MPKECGRNPVFLTVEGMTMWKIFGTAATAGVVALLLGGQGAPASDDTIRLGGNIEAKTTTLSYDGQSDTILTRGVRVVAGYRGARIGVGVGFGGRGHYGNYGHYGHNGYRLGYGYYRPFYSRPYYNSYYYASPYYYSSPAYYYSSPSYYYAPCAPSAYYAPTYGYYAIGAAVPNGGAGVYRPSLSTEQLGEPYQTGPGPVQPGDGGSYRYDGGPANPVPMPTAPKTVPIDSRMVSIPATKTTAGSYPAYGDNLQKTYTTVRVVGTPITKKQ